MSAPDDRDVDDISAVEECAYCGWSPAAVILVDGDWQCYNCGHDPDETSELVTDGGTDKCSSGTDRTLREELAALEHQQWWEWSKTVAREEDISKERIERWRQYWKPYEDLPEDVKDHDRKWADRVTELLWNRLVDTGTSQSEGER